MRFKFFHIPAHRQYNYQPRFYNPRRDHSSQKNKTGIPAEKPALSMREHLIRYRRAEEKNQRIRQIITLIILIAIFIIVYFITKYFTQIWPI